MSRRVEVCSDARDLAEQAADHVEKALNGTSGRFTLALAGGATPRRLYRLLAERDLPWERVHFFWGDERCVPPDHPESNYRMARETLLEAIQAEPSRVHRWPAERPPLQAAEEYGRVLAREFGALFPTFDLVLLGMGEDGHTASLFPGTAALKVEDRAAAANFLPGRNAWRLTLTFPVLNRARRVLFLVSGTAKAPALARVLADEDLPAARVDAPETVFLVDRAALP